MHSLMPTLKPGMRTCCAGSIWKGLQLTVWRKRSASAQQRHRAPASRATGPAKRLEECCGACATHGCLNCTCQHGPGPKPLPGSWSRCFLAHRNGPISTQTQPARKHYSPVPSGTSLDQSPFAIFLCAIRQLPAGNQQQIVFAIARA